MDPEGRAAGRVRGQPGEGGRRRPSDERQRTADRLAVVLAARRHVRVHQRLAIPPSGSSGPCPPAPVAAAGRVAFRFSRPRTRSAVFSSSSYRASAPAAKNRSSSARAAEGGDERADRVRVPRRPEGVQAAGPDLGVPGLEAGGQGRRHGRVRGGGLVVVLRPGQGEPGARPRREVVGTGQLLPGTVAAAAGGFMVLSKGGWSALPYGVALASHDLNEFGRGPASPAPVISAPTSSFSRCPRALTRTGEHEPPRAPRPAAGPTRPSPGTAGLFLTEGRFQRVGGWGGVRRLGERGRRPGTGRRPSSWLRAFARTGTASADLADLGHGLAGRPVGERRRRRGAGAGGPGRACWPWNFPIPPGQLPPGPARPRPSCPRARLWTAAGGLNSPSRAAARRPQVGRPAPAHRRHQGLGDLGGLGVAGPQGDGRVHPARRPAAGRRLGTAAQGCPGRPPGRPSVPPTTSNPWTAPPNHGPGTSCPATGPGPRRPAGSPGGPPPPGSEPTRHSSPSPVHQREGAAARRRGVQPAKSAGSPAFATSRAGPPQPSRRLPGRLPPGLGPRTRAWTGVGFFVTLRGWRSMSITTIGSPSAASLSVSGFMARHGGHQRA